MKFPNRRRTVQILSVLIITISLFLAACHLDIIEDEGDEKACKEAAEVFAESYMGQLDYSDSQWVTAIGAIKKRGITIGIEKPDGTLLQGKEAELYMGLICDCNRDDMINKNEQAWLDSWKGIMTKRCYRELAKDRLLPNTQMAICKGLAWSIDGISKGKGENKWNVDIALKGKDGYSEEATMKLDILNINGELKVNGADFSNLNKIISSYGAHNC